VTDQADVVEGIFMAASPWAGSDFQFSPRGASPVALCGACSRLGSCRLGLGREELQPDGSVHTDLVCGPENEGGRTSPTAAGRPAYSMRSSATCRC
jgi:hypothetical protein